MAKGSTFDLRSILNKASLQEAVKKSEEANLLEYKIHMIGLQDLIDNSENFYNVDNVKDLKDSIEIFGIQQPLIVTEQNNSFKVVAGHRRKMACKLLVEEGKEMYSKVPCIIRKEKDYLQEQLLLIHTNSTTRELTDYEKMEQVKRIKDILIKLRQEENISGRTRDIIKDILNISNGQVARMESINNNLTQEFKEKFKEGKINVSTAYEISGLAEGQQNEVMEQYKHGKDISVKSIKHKKSSDVAKNEVPPKNNVTEEENVKQLFDGYLNEMDIRTLSSLLSIYKFSKLEEEAIIKCVDALWKYISNE